MTCQDCNAPVSPASPCGECPATPPAWGTAAYYRATVECLEGIRDTSRRIAAGQEAAMRGTEKHIAWFRARLAEAEAREKGGTDA